MLLSVARHFAREQELVKPDAPLMITTRVF
jgi:hypothetical protein